MALDDRLEKFEVLMQATIEGEECYRNIVKGVATVVGIHFGAEPSDQDSDRKVLLSNLTEECRAMSNRIFELEVNSMSLEE